jgi:pyruvate kinase
MSRTKIVATIGPASDPPALLEEMIEAGMDVARLNFSHSDIETHGRNIARIRAASDQAGKPLSILQDLSGPKIRIGSFEDGGVELSAGEDFVLTTREILGSEREVSVNYAGLPSSLQVGDPLLLSDGALEFEVTGVTESDIRIVVVHGGRLCSNKGINLPSTTTNIPSLTAKDRTDLAFGLQAGVDYVAISFVRSATDILEAKELIKRHGKATPLIAKIEKHEAIGNIDAILEAADGVMIARGDLGIEIPLEQIPEVQKSVITKANQAGKPVITATQMLGSMVDHVRPTRAEVTDIANAVLDGTDAIMLSEETAVGRYPVLAIKTMRRVCDKTERYFPYKQWTDRFESGAPDSIPEAVSHVAVHLAENLGAKVIIVFTSRGGTAGLISKFRPEAKILAVTPVPESFRRLSLVWGVVPVMIDRMDDTTETVRIAQRIAAEQGGIGKGEHFIITGGLPVGQSAVTNTITTAQL